jgi:hypothetical protein
MRQAILAVPDGTLFPVFFEKIFFPSSDEALRNPADDASLGFREYFRAGTRLALIADLRRKCGSWTNRDVPPPDGVRG